VPAAVIGCLETPASNCPPAMTLQCAANGIGSYYAIWVTPGKVANAVLSGPTGSRVAFLLYVPPATAASPAAASSTRRRSVARDVALSSLAQRR
jgi:hypothetical protein